MLNPPPNIRIARQSGIPLVLGALLMSGFIMNGTASLAAEPSGLDHTLGQPGYLVIEAARDSSAGFRWESGPGPGHRSLVWDQGRLVLPDSLPVDSLGRHDLGVAITEQLAGSGISGQIVLMDGIFPVSEPVVLSDGLLELEISAGELEFRGARIRYRRAEAEPREIRSGLLMLAGMTLLVIVLLRRARLKAHERMGT
jgi:hypothetical protein